MEQNENNKEVEVESIDNHREEFNKVQEMNYIQSKIEQLSLLWVISFYFFLDWFFLLFLE